MKIGIDCRLYGPKHTGIGRYVQNLVENLLSLDKENEYTLFVRTREDIEITRYRDNKLTIVEVDIPHYSLKEQLELPKIISKEKLDLMHFPHFNIPVFCQGRYVVTIHDLIKHTSRGIETTTRSPWLYWFKYLGYKFVFYLAVKKAEKIFVPSNFVKGELVREYNLNPSKIVVTYEGIENKFLISNFKCLNNDKFLILNVLKKYEVKKPFILYVGSVYPHKNIERLIEAIKILNKSLTTNHQPPITLVVVCARNVFIEKLNKYIVQMNAQECVNLAGFVPDEELSILYQEAEAFVFPTLSEGFGLPGLEAMAMGCPVICSNIPVLREVYQNAAVYFDPKNTHDMVGKIKEVIDQEEKRSKMRKEGKLQVKRYSWKKMAKETLEVYKSV